MSEMYKFIGHTITFTKAFQEFRKNHPKLYEQYLRECPNWKDIKSIQNEFQECLKELKVDIDEIKKISISIYIRIL